MRKIKSIHIYSFLKGGSLSTFITFALLPNNGSKAKDKNTLLTVFRQNPVFVISSSICCFKEFCESTSPKPFRGSEKDRGHGWQSGRAETPAWCACRCLTGPCNTQQREAAWSRIQKTKKDEQIHYVDDKIFIDPLIYHINQCMPIVGCMHKCDACLIIHVYQSIYIYIYIIYICI